MSAASMHKRAMEVFDHVCDLPPDEQARAVVTLCGENLDLRREVDAMLRHDVSPLEPLQDPEKAIGVEVLVADLTHEALRASPGGDAALPSRIGQYAIIRRIGEGGMGVVYLARQRLPKRIVALKVIRGAVASGAARRRFEREAHVLGLLAHPSIAQIFEAGMAEPFASDGVRGGPAQPFLAMEFFDGSPITRFAAERRMGSRERMELLIQVCLAVDYAHQKGVIHRDLKPSNILVAEQGAAHSSASSGTQSLSPGITVKILDFGVARLIDDDLHARTVQTDMGQLVGTLQYMSPEQVAADPADLDTRSDVYALGIVMYELLAGQLPYDVHGHALPEAARIIRDETPARLSSIDRMFRGDIETIVSKALEKDKARRYQSAAELAADIRRYLGNEPIVARPATAFEHFRKLVRRNRALAAVIAALLVVLASGAVTSTVMAIRAFTARDEALRKTYLANIAVARGALLSHDITEARRWLGAADEPDRANWEWRYLNAQLDKAVAVLLAPGSAVYCVACSPDESLLASASFDGRVRLWRLDTHEVVAVLEGHERPAYWAEFSPDGSQIVSSSTDRTVRVWDVATARERFVCRGHEAIVPCARFSPDGAMIASCSDDGTVRFWNGATGDALPRRTLGSTDHRVRTISFSADGALLAGACSDGIARVWRLLGDGIDESPVELHGHVGAMYSAQFSHDGTRLASTGQDGMIRIWRTRDWSEETLIDPRGGQVRCAAFSFDGAQLAASFSDMTVRVWDSASGRALGVLTGHLGNVTHVAWSRDGTRLVSASSDVEGSIRIWDASASGDVELLSGHSSGVFEVRYTPDGSVITSVGTDRSLRQWDAATGLPLAFVRSPTRRGAGDRTAINRMSQDGRWLLTASPDGSVKRIDLVSWETFDPMTIVDATTITSLTMSADAKWLAAGENDGSISIVDVESGDLIARPTAVGPMVRDVSFSADGSLFAAGDEAGGLRVWRAPDGPLVAVLEGHTMAITEVQFSTDGSLLASASYDGSTRVWDPSTGRSLFTLEGHAGAARSLAIAPDGRRIATGSGAGAVRLWDLDTGAEIMSMRVTSYPITALAFSPDGATLAIGAADQWIRLCRTVPAAQTIAARKALEQMASEAPVPQKVDHAQANSPESALRAIRAASGAPEPRQRAAMLRLYRELSGQGLAPRAGATAHE